MAKYCHACGERTSPDAKFCNECGTDLSSKKSRTSSAIPYGDSNVATNSSNTNTKKQHQENNIGKKNENEYAGFWERLAAFAIDWIVLILLVTIVAFAVGFAIGLVGIVLGIDEAKIDAIFKQYEPWFNLLGVLIGWLYYASMESSAHQATLGKKLLSMKVTDMDGGQITFAKATGRHFAKIISTIILFIGYIMIVFTQKKQGLHDIIAGTLIVKVK